MNETAPNEMHWLPPWEATDDGSALEAELLREIVDGHPLYGMPATAAWSPRHGGTDTITG